MIWLYRLTIFGNYICHLYRLSVASSQGLYSIAITGIINYSRPVSIRTTGPVISRIQAFQWPRQSIPGMMYGLPIPHTYSPRLYQPVSLCDDRAMSNPVCCLIGSTPTGSITCHYRRHTSTPGEEGSHDRDDETGHGVNGEREHLIHQERSRSSGQRSRGTRRRTPRMPRGSLHAGRGAITDERDDTSG